MSQGGAMKIYKEQGLNQFVIKRKFFRSRLEQECLRKAYEIILPSKHTLRTCLGSKRIFVEKLYPKIGGFY